jgi:hypothetical protein
MLKSLCPQIKTKALKMIEKSTIKPAHAVTSIKQSPVLKGYL